MTLSKQIASMCAFLLSGSILTAIESSPVYAGGENVWEKASQQIVRFSPTAFPQLPKPIQSELSRRECLIPQPVLTGIALQPGYRSSNVISGEFQKPGQTDWAVLCSVEGRSTILVFWNGSASKVEQLGSFSPDKSWLQGMGVDRKTSEPLIEYSRGISSVGKKNITGNLKAYGGPQLPPIDHQGIDDAFLGKASEIRYWYRGKWLTLQGAD